MKNLMLQFCIAFTLAACGATDQSNISSQQFISKSWDGCYLLYATGSMYPVICLDGTEEEGIGGAGVRLVAFRTNTDRVADNGCMKSTASAMTLTSFTFSKNGITEVVLTTKKVSGQKKSGEARIGRTNLFFEQLPEKETKHFIDQMYKQCKF